MTALSASPAGAIPAPSDSNVFDIVLNGEPHTVNAPTTLADLLTQLGHAPASLATAVNGQFVPRGQREACRLSAGDQVTCFEPIVGG